MLWTLQLSPETHRTRRALSNAIRVEKAVDTLVFDPQLVLPKSLPDLSIFFCDLAWKFSQYLHRFCTINSQQMYN